MAFKCPLCLEVLTQQSELIRYCATHQTIDRFAVTTSNTAKLNCQERACSETPTIQAGVFLLHVGCTERNPYWREVEQKTDVRLPAIVHDLGRIQHWQLDMLSEASRVDGSHREMWFPLSLYRATNGLYQRQRVGVLVKLAGPKSVGKTTLTTIAFNEASYHVDVKGYLDIDSYVHVGPVDGNQPEELFLRALYPISLLRLDQSTTKPWVEATRPRVQNIKAVLLRGTERLARKPPSPKKENFVLALMKVLLDGATNRQGGRQDAAQLPPATHYVVTFYDTAGEESEKPDDPRLRRLDQHVDVAAVLVDATHLSRFRSDNANPESSVPIAVERLEKVANPKVRRCMVVTKVDLLGSEARQAASQLAADVTGDGEGERALLISWLSEGTTKERRLARFLKANPTCRVFFVWAEAAHTADRPPAGMGLVKFMVWCLESTVDRFGQPR